MIVPKQKIKVFISSACGEEDWKQKYNRVRKELKKLIEETGFAEVYAFELEGASTISAKKHYINALENSDVCIFIIENKDKITDAVQKEINTARDYNIKSFYYFCNEYSEEETTLQKNLKGPEYAKSLTVNKFDQIVEKAGQDLINELTQIYIYYCRNKLNWNDEYDIENNQISMNLPDLAVYSDSMMKKDVLSEIDGCVQYLTNLIYGDSTEDIKTTSNLDEIGVQFLKVLFEAKRFGKEEYDALLQELEKHQSVKHFEVSQKRIEALIQYFKGNQESCILKLKEALEVAKDESLPRWLRDDILIDLRNQDYIFNETNNIFVIDSVYQKELLSGEAMLYYPQIDRLNSDFKENIMAGFIKDITKSPGTVIYENHSMGKIVYLAKMFLIALCNGSLTHIEMVYKQLKYLCFYIASTDSGSNRNVRLLLLKLSILNGDKRENDGIIRTFGDILNRMSANDAIELYNFSKNSPIPYIKLCNQLKALRLIGYFLDDKNFTIIWSGLFGTIFDWINDENRTIGLGQEILATILSIYHRISQEQLIDIICEFLSKKFRRFYDDVFNVIYQCVNLNETSETTQSQFLNCLINIVSDEDERKHIRYLEKALCRLRKSNKNLTAELDSVIKREMPDFYKGTYLLETTENEGEDFQKFIKKYVSEIKKDNQNQGKDGAYYGKGISPYLTIKNILEQSQILFSQELIDLVFQESVNTILSEKQLAEAKFDAIELVVYLLGVYKQTKDSNKEKVYELMNKRDQVVKAHSIFSNLDESILQLSFLFLELSLGNNINSQLVNSVAIIGDDKLSNRKASKFFLDYLKVHFSALQDKQLEQLFILNAIKWSNLPDDATRRNAVRILFLLLDNPINEDIVYSQLIKLIDTDNVYIKMEILQGLPKLRNINNKCYQYIAQKASVDNNFVVRDSVEMIRK
jgi:hypothetical protein